ncbi:EAL domain-containing protein [Pseudolabrys taiwanensis]|uniref:EAL domain-containing protein n=1 Tax=Pseudolabrys taiwanensis TaxID=331696 RepID=A0A345ZZF7_9HYPH|nr:EAL domain-containing protein [Pseudolabrys taiwanensis]AXK82304.1 EAL domain-containing protein [Pseudolabrys taiwanensis]
MLNPLAGNDATDGDLQAAFSHRRVASVRTPCSFDAAMFDDCGDVRARYKLLSSALRESSSSLYHLRNFKIDKIKLTAVLPAPWRRSGEYRDCEGIGGLGNGLGLTITAEGVEGRSQCDELIRQGCQQAQGFLFSKSVPAAEVPGLYSLHAQGGRKASA